MAGKNTAVFGIYKSSAQAERAVDRIAAAGFSQNDISVLLPDTQSSKEFAHEKNTKVPEGTTTGVTTAGLSGCWLASERWLSRVSVHSSPPGQSWGHWRGWESVAQLVV